MYTKVKIIRTYWGDTQKLKREIPPQPIYTNQIVFVWGEENNQFLKKRGFDTILMSDEIPNEYNSYEGQFYRKLLALDLSLKMFGEVILLDWDCYILRELDDNFYKYIASKPIQIPLYAHTLNPIDGMSESSLSLSSEGYVLNKETSDFILKYSWKDNGMCILPNFGFFYSRDISVGKKLLDIAINNNLKGCADEGAMFIYADCDYKSYIEKYHPVFVNGVSDFVTSTKFKISKTQNQFNNYIQLNLNMDIYLEHM
jgi:hypothetical protein